MCFMCSASIQPLPTTPTVYVHVIFHTNLVNVRSMQYVCYSTASSIPLLNFSPVGCSIQTLY